MPKNVEPKEEIPDIKRRPVILPIQCGDCIFHKNMSIYKKPCIELGTPASAETCAKFVANPRVLGEEAGRVLRILSSVTKPEVLAATMLKARKVKRMGFEIGQVIYWKVLGKDYVNNYASGVVISAADDRLVVAGRENHVALMFTEGLLNREQWKAKLASLVKRDLINDPLGGLRKISVRGKDRLVSYEPDLVGKKKQRVTQARKRKQKASTTKSNVITMNR